MIPLPTKCRYCGWASKTWANEGEKQRWFCTHDTIAIDAPSVEPDKKPPANCPLRKKGK